MIIDLKGLIVGCLVAIATLFIAHILSSLIFVLYLNANGGLYEVASSQSQSHLWLLLFLITASILSSFIGGWVTAKLSKNNKILTALATGVCLTLIELIPYQDQELELTLINAIIRIPVCYLAALIFLKKKNQFNINVS